MKKYNIEGSIDFFSELYKSLDDEEEETIQDRLDQFTFITITHAITFHFGKIMFI
jgi:hypothetical protein